MSVIHIFAGEFLTSPLPLELALNYCSHSCAVCFANLNKPDRKADVKALLTQLKNYPNHSTLTAHLLREKYPVMISNRVDPFATSNYQLTVPIVENLTAQGIPVAFQTRGGKGISDTLEIIKGRKSLFYVSICHTNDIDRKRTEPGAPSIESRWELIDQLQEAGHNVVVGVNPLVPEWTTVDGMITNLIKHKVKNVWIGRLHLNRDQVANMSDREVNNVGSVLLERAKKRGLTGIDSSFHTDFMGAAKSVGIEVFHTGQSNQTNYFGLYHDTYPGKTFPTMQDFINRQWQTKETGDKVRFSEFKAFMLPHLPKGEWALRDYLASVGRIWQQMKVPPKMTFENLLEMFWNMPELKRNMSFYPNFAHVAYRDSITNEIEYAADAIDGESLVIEFSKHELTTQEIFLPD